MNIDVYCQGVQLIGEDKNLNDYGIEHEDSLLIVPKVKLPTESVMVSSAGNIMLFSEDLFCKNYLVCE